MKTLENHKLIYDQDCPMCRVYSGAFVQSKMLEKNGRENFRDLTQTTENLLDLQRAKNEIALVDFIDNKVHYGLDSLLIIIGNSFPSLEKIGRIGFVYWFFSKLYSFVSYNRKQIIPSKNDNLVNSCVPTFNLKYRLVYLFSGLFITTYFFGLLIFKFGIDHNYFQNLVILIGLFVWQFLFFKNNSISKFVDYAGNLTTILFFANLVFIPVLLLDMSKISFQIISSVILVLINIEHFRRCNLLKTKNLTKLSFVICQILIFMLLNKN